MDNLTQAHLLLHQNNPAKVRKYKVPLSEFPLWWLAKSKRNMEGLRDIASHLTRQRIWANYHFALS
jgi:hypothetical protein